MKSITFFVTKLDDVYTASAIESNIITQAKTFDALILNIEEAISLYFESAGSLVSPYTVVFSGQTNSA